MKLKAAKGSMTRRAGGVIGVLDLGCEKIACAVVRYFRDDDLRPTAEIIGLAHRSSIGIAPSGHLQVASGDVIHTTIEAAENMASERIDQILIVINGRQSICRRVAVEMSLHGQPVLQEDIANCLQQGWKSCVGKDQTLLHVWAGNYSLDGREPISDPRGLIGERLCMDVCCITTPNNFLHNIQSTVTRADVAVRGLVASGFAAGQSVLMDDEKQMGCLAIDLGAQTSAFSYWQDGVPAFVGHVPLGGQHIDQDLAKAYSLSLGEAARLKRVAGLMPRSNTAMGGHEASVPPAEIIAPRLEEIFEMVAQKLCNGGIESERLARIVLTGGGAAMEALLPVAEEIFAVRARVGVPLEGWGGPGMVSQSSFAALTGAIHHVREDFAHHFGAHEAVQSNLFDEGLRAAQGGAQAGSGGGKIVNWLRSRF